MTYAIEQGVPVPPALNGRIAKYPWHTMQPGDSFFIACATRDEASKVANSINSCARRFCKTRAGRGLRAIVRKVDGGVRAWLVSA